MTNHDSGTAGDEVREPATPPRTITYYQAQTGYRCTIDARERFEELTNRDLMVRAHATLKARGTYDLQLHGDADNYQPLTTEEHLEILAAGEMLARYYRHPALIHQAVTAGASWPQIAAATGSDEATVRQAYREWADGQHGLHTDYDGKFGMDDAEHAAAAARRWARYRRWCTGAGLDDDELDVPGYRPEQGWKAATGTGPATDLHPRAKEAEREPGSRHNNDRQAGTA